MKLSPVMDSWIALAIAILFGVLGTISMKLSLSLRVPRHVISLAIFYAISFAALTLAIKHIELSMVYAVWSGIGTILMAMVGVIYFKESVTPRKVIFLAFIILGVIGIHLGNVLS